MKKKQFVIAIDAVNHALIKKLWERVVSGDRKDLFKAFSQEKILELANMGLITSRGKYWYFTPRGAALAQKISKERVPFEHAIDFIKTPRRMGNN